MTFDWWAALVICVVVAVLGLCWKPGKPEPESKPQPWKMTRSQRLRFEADGDAEGTGRGIGWSEQAVYGLSERNFDNLVEGYERGAVHLSHDALIAVGNREVQRDRDEAWMYGNSYSRDHGRPR